MAVPLMLSLSALAFAAGAVSLYAWRVSSIRVASRDLTVSRGTLYRCASAGIVGRPDVVLRRGAFYVPVEYKSGLSNGSARKWDIAQVLAYCMIVEECMGPVRTAELVYSDSAYTIPWDSSNREYLLSVLGRIRSGRGTMTAQPWKCRSCEFRSHCGRS